MHLLKVIPVWGFGLMVLVLTGCTKTDESVSVRVNSSKNITSINTADVTINTHKNEQGRADALNTAVEIDKPMEEAAVTLSAGKAEKWPVPEPEEAVTASSKPPEKTSARRSRAS